MDSLNMSPYRQDDVIITAGLCGMDSFETRVAIHRKMKAYIDRIKRTEKQQGQCSSLDVFSCNSKLRVSFGYIFLSFHMKLTGVNAKGSQGSQPLMGTLGKKGLWHYAQLEIKLKESSVFKYYFMLLCYAACLTSIIYLQTKN